MNSKRRVREKHSTIMSLMPEPDVYKGETPYVAIDCEMVICEDQKRHLARLSVVNFNRETLFDEVIQPELGVTNYLTHVTNLDAFKVQHALKFSKHKKRIEKLLGNKIIVGHTLEKDFEALQMKIKPRNIRDISCFRFFMNKVKK